MGQEQFLRTEMLLGEEAMKRLKQAYVAVFGIGGVGGHAIEALVRAGIGAIDIIDNDLVNESNLNRQIIATYDTIGRRKTEAMAERIRRIAPDCQVNCRDLFYLPERRHDIPFEEYDYIKRCANHQQHGYREQAASGKAGDSGYISDQRLPSGEGDAQGIEGKGSQAVEGGLFQGGSAETKGGEKR